MFPPESGSASRWGADPLFSCAAASGMLTRDTDPEGSGSRQMIADGCGRFAGGTVVPDFQVWGSFGCVPAIGVSVSVLIRGRGCSPFSGPGFFCGEVGGVVRFGDVSGVAVAGGFWGPGFFAGSGWCSPIRGDLGAAAGGFLEARDFLRGVGGRSPIRRRL